MNRPRGSKDAALRIPPGEAEVAALFAGWREELATCRKFAPAARYYAAARLMAEVGLRINEVRSLDMADIKWELGRFGKLHVRHGKGSRGSGPRERMVPLINHAGATLRWFIEDVWGHFDADHAAHGAPLFPPNARTSTAPPGGSATTRCAPVWARPPPSSADLVGHAHPARVAALLRQPALPVGHGSDLGAGATWPRLGGHHDEVRPRSPHPHRGRLDRRSATRCGPAGRTAVMKWNLRLAAANRGIWKASELQRQLAEHGLVVSAGKMSGLWSGQPASIKLEDLDIICAVLGCEIGEVLIPAPDKVVRPGAAEAPKASAAATSTVTPRRRDGRTLPPA